MNLPASVRLLPVFAAVLLSSGCGHVDLSPEGDPNRVLTGTVNVRMNLLPPPDAEVLVRVVEPPDMTSAPTAIQKDIVLGEQGEQVRPERVIAEQAVRAPAAMPVAFRIAYHASDEQLRHGLNVEARISWGGRVRFRTVESQAITLATADTPQSIWVEPVQ